jgi:hypothetical protein
MILAVVAYAAPVIESIETGSSGGPVLKRSAARETGLLARTHTHAAALTIRFTFAFPYGHGSRIGVGIDIEAIVACFQDCESLVSLHRTGGGCGY